MHSQADACMQVAGRRTTQHMGHCPGEALMHRTSPHGTGGKGSAHAPCPIDGLNHKRPARARSRLI